MFPEKKLCIDAGTENCPCRLADYGKCIVCSRLSGSGNCGCCWHGACIYNEFLQNGRSSAGQRESGLYKIRKKIWYKENLAVMQIEVPLGLAEKASLPGSYVFMRNPAEKTFFYTPLSIMKADYESCCIHIAVQINGPKTKALMDCEETVEIRGLYRNGLLGVTKLMRPESKRVLCLAKGLGLAPVSNYIRWAGNIDSIDMIVDTEKINHEFVRDALEGCSFGSLIYSSLPLNLSWADEEKYDVIIISASEYYQQNIYVPEAKKVLSNNHTMCCGEGICGACIYTDPAGNIHRMCKECSAGTGDG